MVIILAMIKLGNNVVGWCDYGCHSIVVHRAPKRLGPNQRALNFTSFSLRERTKKKINFIYVLNAFGNFSTVYGALIKITNRCLRCVRLWFVFVYVLLLFVSLQENKSAAKLKRRNQNQTVNSSSVLWPFSPFYFYSLILLLVAIVIGSVIEFRIILSSKFLFASVVLNDFSFLLSA